jgi:hypothetical protein
MPEMIIKTRLCQKPYLAGMKLAVGRKALLCYI